MTKLYILCPCLIDPLILAATFYLRQVLSAIFAPMCIYSSCYFFPLPVGATPVLHFVCAAIFLPSCFPPLNGCNSCGWISSFNNAARRPVGLALRGALVSIRAADSGAEPSGPLTASLHNKRARARGTREASWSVR